jgi:protein associated with RNAse G/E
MGCFIKIFILKVVKQDGVYVYINWRASTFILKVKAINLADFIHQLIQNSQSFE